MISVSVQYSTPDIKFLRANLTQNSKFSDDIIISICSHLFSGEPENKELLKET